VEGQLPEERKDLISKAAGGISCGMCRGVFSEEYRAQLWYDRTWGVGSESSRCLPFRLPILGAISLLFLSSFRVVDASMKRLRGLYLGSIRVPSLEHLPQFILAVDHM